MPAQKKLTPESALSHAAALCAKSEQCETEIRVKLYKWGISSAESDKIIAYLIDNKFIDQNRFAVAYSHDKLRFSGWGRLKIKKGLIQRHIPESAINVGLSSIDEDEYMEYIRRIVANKAKSCDLNNNTDRLKVYRHLFGKGFESGLILQVINELKE